LKGLWGLPILAIGLVLCGCGGSGGSGGGGGVVVAPTEKIFFTVYNDEDDGTIYSMDPNGSNVMPLTEGDDDNYRPIGSLANGKVYFASVLSGSYQIWEVNDDGTFPRRVTDMPSGANPSPHSVSPDGKYLLATAINILSPTSQGDVVRINVATGAYEDIGSSESPEFNPCYSPSGSKIVFGRDLGPNGNDMYTMNANGSNVQVLRATADDEYDARFSPDGSKIAFTLGSGSTYRIFVMPSGGGAATPVTDSAGNYTMAAFSRDGSKIIARCKGDDGLTSLGTVSIGSTTFAPFQTPEGFPSEPFWR
jgi:TolB protein